jgi:hypothetical protein
MTPIPAKVVNIDRLEDDYLITVRVMSEKDAGAFDRLSFGEKKPDLGWYHYGWLDVVYRQDPDLKLGQSFPRCGRISNSNNAPLLSTLRFFKNPIDSFSRQTIILTAVADRANARWTG